MSLRIAAIKATVWTETYGIVLTLRKNPDYTRIDSGLRRMMASSAPTSFKPSLCAEKERLMRAYLEALRSVLELQDQQVSRLLGERLGMDRFDIALQRARENRDQAKTTYTRHIQGHGC